MEPWPGRKPGHRSWRTSYCNLFVDESGFEFSCQACFLPTGSGAPSGWDLFLRSLLFAPSRSAGAQGLSREGTSTPSRQLQSRWLLLFLGSLCWWLLLPLGLGLWKLEGRGREQ